MGNRIIAVGDIHGCYHTMKNLLYKIKYDKDLDTLLFVGDYVDRGLFSFETINFLINLQKLVGKERCICLKGNHEKMMCDANGAYDWLWIINGGGFTIESYEKHPESLESHIAWMKKLPLTYETDNYLFCHAGLSAPQIINNSEKDLLWRRDWILHGDNRPREKTVIFGHTPIKRGEHIMPTGDIAIDTGCVFNKCLTAAILQNGEISFEYEETCIDDIV